MVACFFKLKAILGETDQASPEILVDLQLDKGKVLHSLIALKLLGLFIPHFIVIKKNRSITFERNVDSILGATVCKIAFSSAAFSAYY